MSLSLLPPRPRTFITLATLHVFPPLQAGTEAKAAMFDQAALGAIGVDLDGAYRTMMV
jgi:hypothetical protein